MNMNEDLNLKAKRYSAIKYRLAIFNVIYLLILLFLFQALGISRLLKDKISFLVSHNYLAIFLYALAVLISYYILDFPLNLYLSYFLEHKFQLSNQKIKDWLKDQIKAGIITFLIFVILLEAFYFILNKSLNNWWLWVSIFWIFFSLILARLMPILIIPLFFKYRALSDNQLRQRILNLAHKMGVKILDVFEIDFSKKTLKANAAFVGMGRTKRVILADTLKDKYTYDEIEVILAHEFAHYRLRHLIKLIFINSITIILSFYLIYKTSDYVLGRFGLFSLSDISGLPIVLMYFVILGMITQPLENYLSRRFERNADLLALKTTDLKEAFISMMDKLSAQNLADRSPAKIIKIFFFDHPPIDERIEMAKKFSH
jgi:STE24 endopeptidase